jgi:hypothetical protein
VCRLLSRGLWIILWFNFSIILFVNPLMFAICFMIVISCSLVIVVSYVFVVGKIYKLSFYVVPGDLSQSVWLYL